MYIPLYPRNPFGYGRHALPKSAHDLETNSCYPSCAKPNGVRDLAYDDVSTPKHMPTYEQHTMARLLIGFLLFADQISTQNAKMSKN